MENTYFDNLRTKKIEPAFALKPYITSYYLYENWEYRLQNFKFRALPNGLVEMFFLFNDSKVIFHEKRQKQALSGFVAGIFELDHPMKLRIEVNGRPFRGLSILFTPLGVNRLLATDLNELTNQVVHLDQFWNLKLYWEFVNSLQVGNERVLLMSINDFFLHRINAHDHPTQRIVSVLNSIEQMEGPLSVGRVASGLEISYKKLYRMFVEELGMTPKMYLKIIRFNRACYLLDQMKSIKESEIVYDCGYYDQPHFVREFKSIMKASPRQYQRSSRGKFYINRPYAFK
ncbi:MAG: AraC family transcriptional regulator [Bacteroidales bacterium]